MEITLRIVGGPHVGRCYTFTRHETFLIGRSRHVHLRLAGGEADRLVSRMHCLLEINPPLCRLSDLRSHNGTFLNGSRVTTADVSHGDEIRVGQTVLRLSISDPGDEETQSWQGVPPQSADAADTSRELPRIVPFLRKEASCLTCTARTPDPGESFCHVCLEVAQMALQMIPGYLLTAEVGRGGMGVVYLARREADGMPVAVKTVTPAAVPGPKAVERFLREAFILRELRHRHIVPFHAMGETNGRLYFVMEYVAGPSVAQLLERKGPFSVRSSVRLINELLLALAHAHEKGFVHRDIKPQNLLIDELDGKKILKVADFGLARVYGESTLSGLTMQNEVGGTFGFMAPEQLTDFRNVKPAADQYSAAATLYNFLTGKQVYEPERNPARMLAKMLNEEPAPMLSHRPELPPELAAIVHRALSREPADRFNDVRRFREALLPFVR